MGTVAKMLLAAVEDRVRGAGTVSGRNVVAYSGGVDSSVVAACVNRVFPGRAVAVLGVSASLPQRQKAQAVEVAREDIGVQLELVETAEGLVEEYVANEGASCYHCKVSLYSGLQEAALRRFAGGGGQNVVLFNGTNKDDLSDLSRVGLVAAREFNVVSPLDELTKSEVRLVAKELGLRTATIAASPCLRSRLAPGVRALQEHLALVERCEEAIRATVGIGESANLRFRVLRGSKYRVEVDPELEASVRGAIPGLASSLGFDASDVVVSQFRSGSVSVLSEEALGLGKRRARP